MQLISVAAFLLLPGPAPAQQPANPCEANDYTACYRAHQDVFLETFGLPPAQSRLTAGDEVLRAMFHGRNVNPIVAVEFRRAPGQEPTVSLHLPRRGEPAMPEPAISAAVPLREWERLGDAGRWFDRALVPPPPEPVGDTIWVCADGGLYIVETVDPDRRREHERLRQRVEQTCDDGLATLYAEQLAEAAMRLIPACGTLSPAGGTLHTLAACAMLQGDRMAAALAHDRLSVLRFAEAAEDLHYLFDQDARLVWGGTRSSGGSAVDAWIAGTRGDNRASLFLRRLYGETSERVRVDAVLERWTDDGEGSSLLWQAPVELVLRWQPDQQFHIAEASVGAFTQVPARCQPGRLDATGC